MGDHDKLSDFTPAEYAKFVAIVHAITPDEEFAMERSAKGGDN